MFLFFSFISFFFEICFFFTVRVIFLRTPVLNHRDEKNYLEYQVNWLGQLEVMFFLIYIYKACYLSALFGIEGFHWLKIGIFLQFFF